MNTEIAADTVKPAGELLKLNPQESERFWAKVNKTDDCWLWTASRSRDGYGYFKLAHKTQKPHKISWQVHRGQIPQGLCILHKCDVPACVNPDHLFLGTNLDNVKDKIRKGRAKYANGEKHSSAKLTSENVLFIRTQCDSGQRKQRDLAKMFGVSKGLIGHIASRRNWKHL